MKKIVLAIAVCLNIFSTQVFAAGPGLKSELSEIKSCFINGGDYNSKAIPPGLLNEYGALVINIGETVYEKNFLKNNESLLEDFCAIDGFGLILMELADDECKKIDCYIKSGEEDPRDALRKSIRWDIPEMASFIEAVRIINEKNKNPREKISFRGVAPELSAERTARFIRIASLYDRENAEKFKAIVAHLRVESYTKLDDGDKKEIKSVFKKIKKSIESKKKRITADFSAEEFSLAQAELKTFESLIEYIDFAVKKPAGIDSKNQLIKLRNDVIINNIHYFLKAFKNKKILIFNESIL